jgi:hypothetical protein
VTPWLQVVLDKGLAPVATLLGVGMTLVFTGRREERRFIREAEDRAKQDQRDRAERLRDRRIALFLDVGQHCQSWRAELRRLDEQDDGDDLRKGAFDQLAGRTVELNAHMILLASAELEERWSEFALEIAVFMRPLSRYLEEDADGEWDWQDEAHTRFLSQVRREGKKIDRSAMLVIALLREAMMKIDEE